MDANGQRSWLLADEDDWLLLPDGTAPSGAAYERGARALRLVSRREGLAALAAPDGTTRDAWAATAQARITLVPDTRDRYGAHAWWDEAGRVVRASGSLPGSVEILDLPAERGQVTDLAVGYDDVLYVVVGDAVVLHDLRDRWDPVVVSAPGMTPLRLAPEPRGGVLVLDAESSEVWRIVGVPFPARPYAPVDPTVVRPCSENPDPPRAELLMAVPALNTLTVGGFAVSPAGVPAIVAWNAMTGSAQALLLDLPGKGTRAVSLEGALFPYSAAWVASAAGDALALLVPALTNEALVYPLSEAAAADPLGDFYPLRGHTGEPLLNGCMQPPHYPVGNGDQHPSAPLLPISGATLARRGVARCARPCDSGSTRTVWHRLYLEGCFPPGCGARVLLAATDAPAEPPAHETDEWHEHLFGDAVAANPRHPAAHAAWLPQPSELPFHPGLLDPGTSADLHGRGRAGLFTALVQRPNRPVRALRGRYLWVRVELSGGGRSTPEIMALRPYAARFSYVEHYLPELYHERELGKDADHAFAPVERATTTPADFLERFLATFESVLTPLEDRIAGAWLLTDARTIPEESLEWLAGWLGIALDPTLPADRRRATVAAAAQLASEHGTLTGLERALDLATGGAVRGGEIVVVEDFRLRRTVATILGVDLSDEDDPMLPGLGASGNSFVGDTLVLGNENRKDFLALFQADLPTTAAEDAAIQRLFDRLAHRVTVLVHQEVAPQDLGFIRRVVDAATPSHVQARVVPARYPFMVGIASLIGIDSYLAAPTPRAPIVINRSAVGGRDFLLRLSSLDPRLSGAPAPTGERLVPANP